MYVEKSKGYLVFRIFAYIVLGILTATTLAPMIHMFALSFSDKAAVEGNLVGLIPVGFHTDAYKQVFEDDQFLHAMLVSVERVIVGTAIQLFFIIITAYPLSKPDRVLKGRRFIIWYFIFTTLFGGGLIPTYLLIRDLGLLDTFWVLVIPGALPFFSAIMLMNYIKGLPQELFEAGEIDGAGHMTIMFKIMVPLSLPCLATLTLFGMVGHWNSWFDATIYLNDLNDWPLQALMRTLINQAKDIDKLIQSGNYERAMTLSNEGLQAAQIMVSTLPILIAYPFLQKYFVTGITVGSVKG